MTGNKYRVLFIGGTRYSRPLVSTHEKKVRALTEKLDMTCIAFHQGQGHLHFSQHADFYLVPSRLINYFRHFYFLAYAFFMALILVKKRSIRVVICQSPFEGICGALLKKFTRKIKLIIEIHGQWDEAPVVYHRLSRRFKWLSDGIGRWAIRNSDTLRVISESTHHVVERFDKKVFLFPTYTDIEAFLRAGEMKIVSNRFIFIGQMVRLKGIDTLIEAVALLTKNNVPVEFIMVGAGNDYPLFATHIKRKDLEQRFVFMGQKEQKEVAELIKTSVALILPSHTEGFGRVIIEAFACSRPAIGSRIGAIPELIKDCETGLLVEPGDSAGLADRLCYAVQHPEEMKRMGEAGRRYVQGRFSTKNYVENYCHMIAETLAEP